MSRVKDRTEDFKDAALKQVGYHESKGASVLASVGIHRPLQRLPFTKAAVKTLESIEALEQFVAKCWKDYVDVHHTGEQERDIIEQEAAALIKTCKQQIDILHSHVCEEQVSSKDWLGIRGDYNADTRAHRKGVILILSERLDSVSSQFDKYRAKCFTYEINEAMHRRNLAMLSNNKSVNISTSGNSGQIELKRTHSNTDTSRVQQQFLDDETRALQVPHQKQQSSWDCGLACVLMILQTLDISSCSIQDLKDLCNINSIWTVDLAYLLQKFAVSFSYFTVTLGANPAYSAEKFYVVLDLLQDQYSNDFVRVDMLFRDATKAGIDIQCRSISEQEIALFILSRKYVAVALVDQSKLSDSWLDNIYLSELFGRETAYTGHYIVLCGYNSATDEFEIRDPASSRRSRMITSKCLKEARKSFGTDEDLLLVSLENGEDPGYPAV